MAFLQVFPCSVTHRGCDNERVLDLFICHAPQDRLVAEHIAAALEQVEVRAFLEACGPEQGQTVADAWECALNSAGVLLLLSRSAVPAAATRERWRSLLDHMTRGGQPAIAGVAVEECAFPALLARKHFFDWNMGAPRTLRAIRQWAIALHPADLLPPFDPAPQPWFEGRRDELDLLWDRLADRPGSLALVQNEAGSGKSALAHQFAFEARAEFRDVLWIDAADRSAAALAGSLASLLGVKLAGPLSEALELIRQVLAEHRLLIVFDDATSLPPELLEAGRSSILVTARRPIPHVDFFELMAVGYPAKDAVWEPATVCRRNAIPIDLVSEIAEVSIEEARTRTQNLDPVDGARSRFRSAGPEPRGQQAWSARHAAVLASWFRNWRKHPQRCLAAMPEVESAFAWSIINEWDLAVSLGSASATFLCEHDRPQEAVHTYRLLLAAALARGDGSVVSNCRSELSWLEDPSGEVRREVLAGHQAGFDFGI